MRIRNTVKLMLLVTLGVLSLGSSGWCDKPEDDMATISQFFSATSHSPDDIEQAQVRLRRACFRVGDKALPTAIEGFRKSMKRALADPAEDNAEDNAMVVQLGVECLSGIGGPEVVKLFREMHDTSSDATFRNGAKVALCWSMQSMGPEADVPFLIDALSRTIVQPENGVFPDSAAYALAVLKPAAARAALERRLKVDRFVLSEVKLALARVSGVEWETPQVNSASATDQVILTVFRFGIPETEMAGGYNEPRNNRVWKRTGNVWRHEAPSAKDNDFNAISFDVVITGDGSRAVCSVNTYCGNMCGYSYDYFLKKDRGKWKVVGLYPTWIS